MNKVFGIIGDSPQASLTSAILDAAFSHYKMGQGLKRFELDPADPDALANFCYETDLNGVRGFALDPSSSEAVMAFMDLYDPIAKIVGAVNSVVNEESKLIGYNTDAVGALQALQEKTFVPGKKALIMGAGKSGRAVAYSLKEFGADVFVFNRTLEKAEALAKEFKINAIEHRNIPTEQFDIIVNATPVGSRPQTDNTLLSADQIPAHAVVMDLLISPLQSQLLKEARRAGALTVSGDRMALFSALRQFELWLGQEPPLDAMEQALAEALENLK